MLKTISKLSVASIIALSIVSCGSDDDSGYSVPNSYSFDNASYSGQTSRIDMLKEMTAFMKTADETTSISATTLKKMYANDGFTWTSSPFASAQPTKQLKNKTYPGASVELENWMDKLESITTPLNAGSNGVAGIVKSGTKAYIFDDKGFEPIQFIDKGIMGAVFYYQGTSVYLSEEKIGGAENDENKEGKDYTDMQHYWDEAFGYASMPTDLNSTNIGQKKTDGELAYYSKYLKKADDAGLSTVNELMAKGFIAGRAAIDNKNMGDRDIAISIVQKNWEMINVAAGLHYMNAAITNLADNALRNHELSEAYVFVNNLKYNTSKVITDAQITEVLDALGDNFYTITADDITNAKTKLATIYNVDANNF